MKLSFVTLQQFRSAAWLAMALSLGNVALSAPSIQSIEVSPNPVITGQIFDIAVTASPDVTQATAIVDFRAAAPRSLQVPLTKQGPLWTGSGLAPTDVQRQLPFQAGAMVRVLLFNAVGLRAEGVVQVGVHVESISAVFADGILTVTGDDQANTITVSQDAAGTIFVNGGAVPVAGARPTIANTSLIRILGLGGNDRLVVDDGNGLMPPANLLGGEGDDNLIGSANADDVDGGSGNDVLSSRGGIDRLLGGSGDDTLVGGSGSDEFFGGAGDDEIVWNPGDGSDLVEGEDGIDTMVFVGANISETVDVSANGQRLRFFRNPANITMDCKDIEQVIFRALGGADQVTVNDLTGTDVGHVVVDLSNVTGTGDGQPDTVFVNGTETNDVITVSGSTNEVNVLGLATTVAVVGVEQGLDPLVINSLGAADTINAFAVEAPDSNLTLNGGAGNDTLVGGQGDDLLIGAQGTDVMVGEAGDDTFVWNPGDGSDVVEGRAGQDTLLFNGANVGEGMDLSANGQRLRFFRNVGNITMDCNDVEAVQVNALGGADTITVNDLSGTSVTRVDLDLESPLDSGAGDQEADTIVISGTEGDDDVVVAGNPEGMRVEGLAATVSVLASEGALDQLTVKLRAGNDVARASDLQDGIIKLTADGGPGDDVLVGSAGSDVLLGDEGDDVLQGGPGLDNLDGGPGDNVVIQD